MSAPPKFTAPTPVLVTLRDPTLIAKAPVAVLEPLNVTVKGPPFVAVTGPPRMISCPLRVIPAIALVLMPTLEDIVLDDVILTEEAFTPFPVISRQLVTRYTPSRFVPPNGAAKRISPMPAVRVKSTSPLRVLESTVLENVMLPAPALVERTVAPVKEMALAKERLVFTVKRVPERLTAPPPFCAKVPAIDVEFPATIVRTPELAIVTLPPAVVITFPLMEIAVPAREIVPATVRF